MALVKNDGASLCRASFRSIANFVIDASTCHVAMLAAAINV